MSTNGKEGATEVTTLSPITGGASLARDTDESNAARNRRLVAAFNMALFLDELAFSLLPLRYRAALAQDHTEECI